MSCPEVRDEIKQLLDKLGIEEDEAKVYTRQMGEMCACDVNFKSPLLRVSIMNSIRELLEAKGYKLDADVASRCYAPERPLALRLNVWKKRD